MSKDKYPVHSVFLVSFVNRLHHHGASVCMYDGSLSTFENHIVDYRIKLKEHVQQFVVI